MSSILRSSGFHSATQRPMVGDTKTSMVRADHLGWLLCDGRSLARSDFKSLFAVPGTDFGSDDAETFRLPDARGRVSGLINVDNENTDANPDLTGWTDGDVSGEETHTLTIAEIPAHNHDISGGALDVSGGVDPSGEGRTSANATGISVNAVGDHTHTYSTYANADRGYVAATDNDGVLGGTQTATTSAAGAHTHTITDPTHRHTIASNGGSQPHNNIQPTIFLGNLFIYSGRINFNDPVAPTGNRSYFPPEQTVRLY